MNTRGLNIVRLQDYAGGVAQGIRMVLAGGRYEVVTNGPNPEFEFIGSDPYNTNVGTGLVVPATPSAAIGGARYLFLLARASFSTGEQSASKLGVRLVGIRQYADLVARIPVTSPPTPPLAAGVGPPVGATVTFHKEIKNPMWHPPDGDISWHVMILPRTQRDTRHPLNADGVIFQDALSPALLFQTLGPYSPPNGGRPWGTPLGASLGNIHELRYRWRTDQSERVLDIPIPVPCDVCLYASVRQNDPTTNPTLTDCTALSVLDPEDQFLLAYNNFAQYGTIAGALCFDQNLGEDVP